MLIGYICGTTVSRSKNAAPNEYGHLWEEIEQNRLSTVKEKSGIQQSNFIADYLRISYP
jgi:hypothetical protein